METETVEGLHYVKPTDINSYFKEGPGSLDVSLWYIQYKNSAIEGHHNDFQVISYVT